MNELKFWEQTQMPISISVLNIVLIAHVREPRGLVNTAQLQYSETERFSIDEFNEIYQGVVAAGYFVQAIYFNELNFINDYVEHPERYKNNCSFCSPNILSFKAFACVNTYTLKFSYSTTAHNKW